MSSNHYQCYFKRSFYCHLCTKYIPSSEKRNPINQKIIQNFQKCYNQEIKLEHSFKPSSFCNSCRLNIDRCANGQIKLKIKVPPVYKKPKINHSNCYICLDDIHFNKAINNRSDFERIKNTNVIRPVLFDDDIDDAEVDLSDLNEIEIENDEVEINTFDDFELNETSSDHYDESEDEIYQDRSDRLVKKNETSLCDQQEITDLFKLMKLTGDQMLVLSSFLKKHHFTVAGFKISNYKNHLKEVDGFFSKFDDETVYLSNLYGKKIFCS